MSHQATTWARAIRTGSATNKAVLLAVANYANENNVCWPSQERLAEDTELSRRSIVRALDDLETAGHIVRERRHRSDGSRKTDLIRLNLDATMAHSKKTQSDTQPSQCDTVPSQDDTVSKTKCHGVTAEPLIEPSIEPLKEPSSILYDAGFEEFWAAYPRRPNNPKKPASLKYMAARKRGIAHEVIMAGVNAYAAMRSEEVASGSDPKFTKLAETWLNKECWANDYTVSETSPKASKPKEAAAADADLDAIVSQYPGVVSDRTAAKKALAAELAKGVELKKIAEAAEKFKLYIQQMKQNDVPIAAPILETWLKFKWREMDAYFIFKSAMQRYPTLKPVSEKPKWWGKL